MIQLELTKDECAILRDILQNDLSDLRMEIADTDRLAYREMLRERKRVLKKVLATLDPP